MGRKVKKMSQEQIEEALVKVDEAYTALCSIGDLICDNSRETSSVYKRYCSLRLKTWKLENFLQNELAKRRRIARSFLV